MIEKLTEEQEALLSVYRDKWVDIGLATGPVDFEKAKAAVCKAYRMAGLKEPTQFHVAKSPMDAIKIIQKLDSSLKPTEIYSGMVYGNHDADWLGYYEYFYKVLGIEACKKLEGFMELAQHCGWLNMYEDVVVFQDRPEVLKFDDQKRLHSEDGPAILYSDGYAVYSWHGVAIPSAWIESREELTAKEALSWDNIEQRRCACEIIGWANVLRELNARTIDVDDNPMIGTLVEVDIPDVGENEKFLKVLCGTGREFAIPVPPDMTTALEATAWTYGLDGDILRELEVRT